MKYAVTFWFADGCFIGRVVETDYISQASDAARNYLNLRGPDSKLLDTATSITTVPFLDSHIMIPSFLTGS